MSPDVSVYCTVRNGEATLPRTLESIAAQRGVTWELVVVDDGSSDRTVELLHRFAAGFAADSVRIVATGGIGRGAALNRAWRECRGNYLANIDADDLFHPDKLRLQHAAMTSHPDVAVLATDNLYIGAGETPRWPAPAPNPAAGFAADPAADPALSDVTRLLGRFNPVNHSSVMMRRGVLEAVSGYHAQRSRQLDYELWIRIASRGIAIHQLNVPLSAKRLHDGQTFEARFSPAYILSSFALQNRAIRALRLPLRYYALSALRLPYRLLPRSTRRFLTLFKRKILYPKSPT